MADLMSPILMKKLPLKFEQICIYSGDSHKKALEFSNIFGLDPAKIVYDSDHTARGFFLNRPAQWTLRLAYVYHNGLEIEFLQFVKGVSFHDGLLEGELSHMGTHVESCDKFIEENPGMKDLILLDGELWKGEKGWRYLYFETVRSFGFRLKIIERKNR